MSRGLTLAVFTAALISTAWCASPGLPIKLEKNHFFKGKITYTVTASCEITSGSEGSFLVDAAGAFKAELGAYDTDHYPVTLTPCTGAPVQLQQVTATDGTGVLLAASLEKKLALVYYAATPTEGGDAVQTLAVVTDAATKTHVAKDAVASAQLAISGDKYIVAYKKGSVSQLVVLGGATDIDKELTAAVTLGADGLHFTEGGKNYIVAFTSDLFTDAAKTLADCSERTEDKAVTVDDSMKSAYKKIAKEFTGHIEPAGAVEVCPVEFKKQGRFNVSKISCEGADVVADTKGTRYSAVCADYEAEAYAMYQLAVVVPESATGISGSTGYFVSGFGAPTPVAIVAGAATPALFVTEAQGNSFRAAAGAFSFAAQELVAPEITRTVEIKGEGEPVDVTSLIDAGADIDEISVEDGVCFAVKESSDTETGCDRDANSIYKLHTLGQEQPKTVHVCADYAVAGLDKVVAVNVSAEPKKLEVIEIPFATGEPRVVATFTDYELAPGGVLTPTDVDIRSKIVIADGGASGGSGLETYLIFNYKRNFVNTVRALDVATMGGMFEIENQTASGEKIYIVPPTDDLFAKKGGQLGKDAAVMDEYTDSAAKLARYLVKVIACGVASTSFKTEGVKAPLDDLIYSAVSGAAMTQGDSIAQEKKKEGVVYHALGIQMDTGKHEYALAEFSLNFEQFKAATMPEDVAIEFLFMERHQMTYREGDKIFLQPCAAPSIDNKGLSAGAIAGIVIAAVVVVAAVALAVYFLAFKK